MARRFACWEAASLSTRSSGHSSAERPPKKIAQDFAAVSLSDVYAIIAYYLRHCTTIDDYMAGRAIQHADLRHEIERDSDYQEFRGRLLARKKASRRGPA